MSERYTSHNFINTRGEQLENKLEISFATTETRSPVPNLSQEVQVRLKRSQ